MPDNFIDLVVTSPPYDDLRSYKGFSFPFEDIAKELFRTVKDGGVVVWVVGDACVDGTESGTSFRQALFFKEIGFCIHDTMIYEKSGSAYPASDKSTRYSQIFEYMFVFSKGKPKTINLIKDKLNRWGGSKNFGTHTERQKDGSLLEGNKILVSEYGYRNNIWRINTGYGYTSKDDVAFEHPAIFPEKLAGDHVRTWSNEGDLIYDPFMGSGTTAKVSIAINRNYIGSEISKEYIDIINRRLHPYISQKNLF